MCVRIAEIRGGGLIKVKVCDYSSQQLIEIIEIRQIQPEAIFISVNVLRLPPNIPTFSPREGITKD